MSMAEVYKIYEIGVPAIAVGILQGIDFSLQNQREILRQVHLQRGDETTFDQAIAEAGRRRGGLKVGNQRQSDGSAIIAQDIEFRLKNRVAEPVAVADERTSQVVMG
jgi:hypothetical protein